MEGSFDAFIESVPDLATQTVQSTVSYLLTSKKDIYRDLSTAYDGYYTLLILPTGRRLRGIPYYPYNYPFYEAMEELEASIILAFSGYYKGAMQHLRFFIELVVLGLYFFRFNEEFVKQWILGKVRTPMMQDMLKTLETTSLFGEFTKMTGISFKDELYRVYDELSGYVHTRGAEVGWMQLRGASVPILEPQALTSWVLSLRRVVQTLALGFVARFPACLQGFDLLSRIGFFYQPRGTYLEPEQAQLVRGLFDESTLGKLQPFSDTYYAADFPIDKQKVEATPKLTPQQLEATWNDMVKAYRLADQGYIPGKTYDIVVTHGDNTATSIAKLDPDSARRVANRLRRQMDILDEIILADGYVRQMQEANTSSSSGQAESTSEP